MKFRVRTSQDGRLVSLQLIQRQADGTDLLKQEIRFTPAGSMALGKRLFEAGRLASPDAPLFDALAQDEFERAARDLGSDEPGDEPEDC